MQLRENDMGRIANLRRLLLLASVLATLSGCHLAQNRGPAQTDMTAQLTYMPRELDKVLHPDYVIEPPDVLTIDALSTLPNPPYHLQALDIVVVQVALDDGERPIDGAFAIELDGSIRFGSPYDDPNGNPAPEARIDGPIKIAGLTLDEATDQIREHLGKTFRAPALRVSLGQITGMQPIAGEHLVAPDGTVNLGMYGRVRVAGLTVEQAKIAIESHLSQYLLNPTIAVDVYAYNSKSYYVILQGAGLGDRALRFAVTGNETALDAVTELQGLSGVSSLRMWIARPSRGRPTQQQVLPVDWNAITQNGDTRTNYQLLPGDRLFVAQDELVATDTRLGKLFAPLERVFGIVLLGTSAAQRVAFFDDTGVAR